MKTLTLAELIEELKEPLQLSVVNPGVPLTALISHPRIQKPALALAGFLKNIHSQRVQVFGETEMTYLATLAPEVQEKHLSAFFRLQFPCLLVTKGLPIPEVMINAANAARVVLCSTPIASGEVIQGVANHLAFALAPEVKMHGTLVDIHGIGVLILGQSGLGKSESALSLVVRGHRLIVDDFVTMRLRQDGAIIGYGNDILEHNMEVRGIGVINIRDLYGVAAIRFSKRVQLIIRLVEWDPSRPYERLGLDEPTFEILDVPLPLVEVPAAPGRNIATIIEVAARNQLLKMMGVHSGEELDARLAKYLKQARKLED